MKLLHFYEKTCSALAKRIGKDMRLAPWKSISIDIKLFYKIQCCFLFAIGERFGFPLLISSKNL